MRNRKLVRLERWRDTVLCVDISSGDIHDHTVDPHIRLIFLGWCLYISLPMIMEFSAYYNVPVIDPTDDTVAYHYMDFLVRTFGFKLGKKYCTFSWGWQTLDCQQNYAQFSWPWRQVYCLQNMVMGENGWNRKFNPFQAVDEFIELANASDAHDLCISFHLYEPKTGKSLNGYVRYYVEEYVYGNRFWRHALLKKSWFNSKVSLMVIDPQDPKADRLFFVGELPLNINATPRDVIQMAYAAYKQQGYYATHY